VGNQKDNKTCPQGIPSSQSLPALLSVYDPVRYNQMQRVEKNLSSLLKADTMFLLIDVIFRLIPLETQVCNALIVTTFLAFFCAMEKIFCPRDC
jgi:hypothetical protein